MEQNYNKEKKLDISEDNSTKRKNEIHLSRLKSSLKTDLTPIINQKSSEQLTISKPNNINIVSNRIKKNLPLNLIILKIIK